MKLKSRQMKDKWKRLIHVFFVFNLLITTQGLFFRNSLYIDYIQQSASTDYQRICAKSILAVDVLRWCGMSHLADGNVELAKAYLETAYGYVPNRLNAYWYGVAQEKASNYASALQLFNQAGLGSYWPTDLEINDTETYDLSKAIVNKNVSPTVHYELGKLIFKIDKSLAQAHFEKSFSLLNDEGRFSRAIGIGWFYIGEDEFENASFWANKAKIIRPTNTYPYEIQAASCRIAGDQECEIQQLKLAIDYALTPVFAAQPQTRLASIYIQLNEYEEALPLLIKASKHHQQPCWATYRLMEAYTGLGSCTSAQLVYTNLIEVCQDSSFLGLVDTVKDSVMLSCSEP
jgi:tetratricopeptide (TPR) repeat protein